MIELPLMQVIVIAGESFRGASDLIGVGAGEADFAGAGVTGAGAITGASCESFTWTVGDENSKLFALR
jgi:hypothetical protein